MENHHAHTQEIPRTSWNVSIWCCKKNEDTDNQRCGPFADSVSNCRSSGILSNERSFTSINPTRNQRGSTRRLVFQATPQLPIKAYTSRVHRDSLSDDCPMDVPNLMVNSRVWWSHIHIWLSQKEISLWLKRFKKHLFSGLNIIKSLYVG